MQQIPWIVGVQLLQLTCNPCNFNAILPITLQSFVVLQSNCNWLCRFRPGLDWSGWVAKEGRLWLARGCSVAILSPVGRVDTRLRRDCIESAILSQSSELHGIAKDCAGIAGPRVDSGGNRGRLVAICGYPGILVQSFDRLAIWSQSNLILLIAVGLH